MVFSPMMPSRRPSVWDFTRLITVARGRLRALATRGACRSALATLMSGSSPEKPDGHGVDGDEGLGGRAR